MSCANFRTAVSARVDGEGFPPGVSAAALDAHLSECGECRTWDERVRLLKQATDQATDRVDRAADRKAEEEDGIDRLLQRLRRTDGGTHTATGPGTANGDGPGTANATGPGAANGDCGDGGDSGDGDGAVGCGGAAHRWS